MKSTGLALNDMKENEILFQNNKYGNTVLNEAAHRTDKALFEARFLTAKEKGGNSRGVLFNQAVSKLLKNDIRGKKVLDYCCGRGDLAVYLSQFGAEIYGFDISKNAIEVANFKAAVNNQKIDFKVMDAEKLSYPDSFFDYVIGFEALHHVILYQNVPAEINRILKKDGKAIFAENWGHDNIFYQIGRRLTALKSHKSDERGEVILHKKLISEKLNKHFQEVVIENFSLLYIFKKYISNKFLLRVLRSVDSKLLKFFPSFSRLCGEAVLVLKK
ncbi:class I SAM-dependent methyltransferase [Ilyomonas limi]|uniref:Class I SAM-dependent methyltransferase n=1 Tax=Ilyomonas limi TaxID=2575867 RepID=A0A4U3L1S2_9BACT|nr:class I SAM-dependent methyltransferase [Ilyomonas limi]TKK67397.1 class I SAM-dependent methyltransferase [Ilyomonas limi]